MAATHKNHLQPAKCRAHNFQRIASCRAAERGRWRRLHCKPKMLTPFALVAENLQALHASVARINLSGRKWKVWLSGSYVVREYL